MALGCVVITVSGNTRSTSGVGYLKNQLRTMEERIGSQCPVNLCLHNRKYEIYRVCLVSGIQGLPCGGHFAVGVELA